MYNSGDTWLQHCQTCTCRVSIITSRRQDFIFFYGLSFIDRTSFVYEKDNWCWPKNAFFAERPHGLRGATVPQAWLQSRRANRRRLLSALYAGNWRMRSDRCRNQSAQHVHSWRPRVSLSPAFPPEEARPMHNVHLQGKQTWRSLFTSHTRAYLFFSCLLSVCCISKPFYVCTKKQQWLAVARNFRMDISAAPTTRRVYTTDWTAVTSTRRCPIQGEACLAIATATTTMIATITTTTTDIAATCRRTGIARKTIRWKTSQTCRQIIMTV